MHGDSKPAGNLHCGVLVGRNIHAAFDGRLAAIQSAMEREMASVTLADVVSDTKKLIES